VGVLIWMIEGGFGGRDDVWGKGVGDLDISRTFLFYILWCGDFLGRKKGVFTFVSGVPSLKYRLHVLFFLYIHLYL